jgi:hypothetical protein
MGLEISHPLTHTKQKLTRRQTKTVAEEIAGPKRDEETGGWRKLHNEELHNLYSSPSVIRMIKGYWWESQKERDHWEEQDVGGWTILKWILER